MTTVAATYDQVAVPSCTVSRETSATSGRSVYTLTIELLESSPNRLVTAEERVAGIISLDPPTVSHSRINDLIRLAILACSNAYEATDGFVIDGEILASIAHRVSYSAVQSLRKLGEDV